jgi:tetratricopeptide (TPR) repeat protein
VRCRGWLAVLAALAAGCTMQAPLMDQRPAGTPSGAAIELTETPFFAQEAYQCGPAALATVLQHANVKVQPEELVPRVYLPQRRGSLQTELVATARAYGRVPYQIDPSLKALIDELQVGHPVLVLQNLGLRLYAVWHYAVVIGYAPSRDELILRSGRDRRLRLSTRRFLKSWEPSGYWGLVVLTPGQLPASPDPARYLQSVAALEEVGQFEAAQRAYAAAVRQWPDNPTAWFGLGNAHYGTGSPAAAVAAYRQTLELDPANAAARNNLALTLADRGFCAAALATLRTALAGEPPDSPVRKILLDTQREIIERRQETGESCQPPVRP